MKTCYNIVGDYMSSNDFKIFKAALINNDKSLFDTIEKADLHTHATLSSNRKIFLKFFPNKTLEIFKKNNNINSLSLFIKNNIIDITTTREGQLKLLECTILTAIQDGVRTLDTSVDYRHIYQLYNNNIKQYIYELKKIKNIYKDKIIINYDIGISRNAYKKNDYIFIKKLIKSNVFNVIDIYGDELSKPIKIFKKIYRFAEKNKLILKAHVGEFGNAKDIYKAINILHLNEVQHGISIIQNKKVMRYAKKHNIIFNISTISNLKLKRINNIKNHPIREMFDYGLIVTINTDDELIFENSLFDEYYILYKNNIFSIEELNKIRLNSLKKVN